MMYEDTTKSDLMYILKLFVIGIATMYVTVFIIQMFSHGKQVYIESEDDKEYAKTKLEREECTNFETRLKDQEKGYSDCKRALKKIKKSSFEEATTSMWNFTGIPNGFNSMSTYSTPILMFVLAAVIIWGFKWVSIRLDEYDTEVRAKKYLLKSGILNNMNNKQF